MKEIISYKCEQCGFTNENKEKVAACESYHHKIVHVQPMFYCNSDLYPEKVKVTFDDGSETVFKEE